MLSQRTRIALWIAACSTGCMGVINLVSAVTRSLPERVAFLKPLIPFEVRASGHVFAAISGFILLTLAIHLLRRKRVAWLLTTGLLIVSIVSHLVKGLDYEESLFAGALLLQLLWMQDIFTAESDPPSIRQGVQVLIMALLFTLAYGTVGFWLLDGQFQTNFNLREAIIQTLAIFFTEDNAGLEPKTHYGEFFINSLYMVGTGTITYAVWMLLRPVLLRDATSPQQRQRAREIIDQYGQTSLARLALLLDKSYYFSPTGRSVVAYVAKGRAAIALGDPIGPLDDREETIISFQHFCNQNDWFAAFYEVSATELPRYHRVGFRSLQIGEEAIVDLTTFSLKGKSNQNLRTAVNRLSRTGYGFQFYEPPLANPLLLQLKSVSNAWLHDKKGAEKQFSVGWFHDDYLRYYPVGVVYNADKQIVAFMNLLTGYSNQEVTIDLMRHRPDAPSGTMDFLFVSLFQHFQQLGYSTFNLSLSPLAGVGEAPDSYRSEKALRYLSHHLNQFYNFKGLHLFKEKFRPQWEARYLAYPSRTALPYIVVGLIRADSGDRLLDYIKPNF